MLHPASHEFVEQSADHQVAIGGIGGHDPVMDDAPALVLLHGFTNSGASWEPVISGLGQRYRAHAPDIRGHASAADLEPVTLEAVLDDIAQLPYERFTLVGYSQGGRIAIHVALAMPERVTRLVLIGASPGLADDAERTARRLADERLAQRIETLTIEQFAVEWSQTPILADVGADVAGRAHADRLRSTPAGLAAALRGLGSGALPSLWERLGELRMPVSLIVGERDSKFSELAVAMSALIADSTVLSVPGAGHAVHLERPDAVAAEILRVPWADEALTEAKGTAVTGEHSDSPRL
jgi:2-succinyl-6-hydroxy-2,4-cyclohexadiene-1-carboxylate synthase